MEISCGSTTTTVSLSLPDYPPPPPPISLPSLLSLSSSPPPPPPLLVSPLSHLTTYQNQIYQQYVKRFNWFSADLPNLPPNDRSWSTSTDQLLRLQANLKTHPFSSFTPTEVTYLTTQLAIYFTALYIKFAKLRQPRTPKVILKKFFKRKWNLVKWDKKYAFLHLIMAREGFWAWLSNQTNVFPGYQPVTCATLVYMYVKRREKQKMPPLLGGDGDGDGGTENLNPPHPTDVNNNDHILPTTTPLPPSSVNLQPAVFPFLNLNICNFEAASTEDASTNDLERRGSSTSTIYDDIEICSTCWDYYTLVEDEEDGTMVGYFMAQEMIN